MMADRGIGGDSVFGFSRMVGARVYLRFYEYLQRIHTFVLAFVIVFLLSVLFFIQKTASHSRYVVIGAVDGRPLPRSPAPISSERGREAAEKVALWLGSLSWEDRDEALLDISRMTPPSVFRSINRGLERHDLLNSRTMLANYIHSRAVVEGVVPLSDNRYELHMRQVVESKGATLLEKEYYAYITLAPTAMIERYPRGVVVIKYVESPLRLVDE